MALTNDILKANASLNGLTDAQYEAIVALSANDETAVIGKRIGEIYREMDNKILSHTGIQRDGDEKTYVYLERASKALKEKANDVSELQTKVTSAEKEQARLQKIIDSGDGNNEVAKQLKQAKADLESITVQYNTLKGEFDSSKENHSKELYGLKIQTELEKVKSGLKIKSDIAKPVAEVLLKQVEDKIKSIPSEFIDNGTGSKILVFKGENGEILRNPENQLNPFTISDLVTKELKPLNILDEGRNKGGAGSSGTGEGSKEKIIIDITSAKNRVEANKIARTQLLEKGLTVGSEAYETEMQQIWKDNKIAELPEN